MIEILLLILKIIGIIILCVIGLAVLILLIVSWVPLRYGADFSKYEKLDLSVYVTWFLKAVSFRFFLKDGTHGIELKLLGKSLGGKKEAAEGGSEGREEKPQEDVNSADEETAEKKDSGSGTSSDTGVLETASPETEESEEASTHTEEPPAESERPEVQSETVSSPEAGQSVPDNDGTESAGTSHAQDSEKPESSEGDKPETTQEQSSHTQSETQESDEEPIPLDERLDKLLYGFQEKYTLFEDKWEDIRDKYEFLTGPHAMREYSRTLRSIRRILGHLLPVKLTGRIHYGLDSPAVTGQILAYYCATAPIHRYSLIPEPDFTEKVIEGEAQLKGRIFIGYIIIRVLGIALNRDVVYLLLNFRKHFRKSQEGKNGR